MGMNMNIYEAVAMVFITTAAVVCQLIVMIAAYRAGRQSGLLDLRLRKEMKLKQQDYTVQFLKTKARNLEEEFEKLRVAHKRVKEDKGRILGDLRKLRRAW